MIMKAKTKIQKEVIGLSRKMHKLSDIQKRYAFEHCFDHLAHRNAKNVITCMECGHVWNGGSELADTLLGVVCPHCGKRLEFVVGRKRVYKEKITFPLSRPVSNTRLSAFSVFNVLEKLDCQPTSQSLK